MRTPPANDSFGPGDASDNGSTIEAIALAAPPLPTGARPWRQLLDWSSTSAPVALLLLSGIALGPRGINLLSVDTLSVLAAAVPVALAALGVLVGLSLGFGRSSDRRALSAAATDAVLTLLVVSLGLGVLAFSWSGQLGRADIVVLAGAGICAASSLTLPTGNWLEPRSTGTRHLELEVLAPILLGGLVLAWVRTGTTIEGVMAIGAATVLTCAVATAAWLLMTLASSDTEKGVLTIAALLLVGGVSDALSTSALFVGVVAGLLWRYAGRRPLETIARDVLFIQHPLLVVVLLAAGANASLSRASLVFGAAYVVLRVFGRLLGGAAATRVSGAATPAGLGLHLLPPGVFGVAFALNALGVVGGDASTLLGTVVLGTIGSELVAFRLAPVRITE